MFRYTILRPTFLCLLLVAFCFPDLSVAARDEEKVLKKGLVAIQAGNYGEARKLYLQVLSQEPENPEALYRLGILSYLDKEFDRAAEYFERSVKADPARVDAWKRLGDSFEKLKRFRQAAESYSGARQVEYQRSLAEKEGMNWLLAHEFQKAREVFEALVLEDPGDYHSVYYLGNAVLSQGDSARAERCYQAAIRLRPELVEAYVNLASIRFQEGKFQEAAQLLEKTFEVSPMSAPFDPTVRLNLGLACLRSNAPDRAEMHLKKYLELCPSCPKAAEVRSILDKLADKGVGARKGSGKSP